MSWMHQKFSDITDGRSVSVEWVLSVLLLDKGRYDCIGRYYFLELSFIKQPPNIFAGSHNGFILRA